jgi:hypothetical protein
MLSDDIGTAGCRDSKRTSSANTSFFCAGNLYSDTRAIGRTPPPRAANAPAQVYGLAAAAELWRGQARPREQTANLLGPARS